ncbi:MAG: sigma-70 family RNA polymerase sigma factor [Planctomycetes bacterium]|nr:sigma-70 family RNA polymerase sigma factor [Planctomycetota bacterium]
MLRAFVAAAEPQRQASFRLLVERHGAMVAGVCRRIAGDDADDAVQAAFLVLSRRAGELADHPSLGGWLHRTAVQIALHQRESRATRRRHEQEGALMPPSAHPVDARTMRIELRCELDAALDQLAERYRTPLVLHYFEGRSQAEVAATLAISVGTMTSLLSRARERLRERLIKRGVAVPLALMTTVLAGEAAAELSTTSVDLACHAVGGSVSPAVVLLADVAGPGVVPIASAALHVVIIGGVLALTVVAAWMWWPSADAVASSPGPLQAIPAAVRPATIAPTILADPLMDANVRAVFATLPPAVRASVARATAAGARVLECEVEMRDGAPLYDVEIATAEGQVTEWTFAGDGTLIGQHADDADDADAVPSLVQPGRGADF